MVSTKFCVWPSSANAHARDLAHLFLGWPTPEHHMWLALLFDVLPWAPLFDLRRECGLRMPWLSWRIAKRTRGIRMQDPSRRNLLHHFTGHVPHEALDHARHVAMATSVDVADVRVVPVIVCKVGSHQVGMPHEMRCQRIAHAVMARSSADWAADSSRLAPPDDRDIYEEIKDRRNQRPRGSPYSRRGAHRSIWPPAYVCRRHTALNRRQARAPRS